MPIRRFNTMLLSQNKQYSVSSGKSFARDIEVSTTGGSVSSAGGYTIHTFTSTAGESFTTNGPVSVEYLVIGGGGNGAYCGGGGGGAGGLISGSALVTNTSESVVVGARTEQSSFLDITAYAGSGNPPGSGAGHGLWSSGAGQSGTPGQGNNGGASSSNGHAGGGGGGAGQVGGNAITSPKTGGKGGDGLSVSITGASTTYAGGGGGGCYYGSADSSGGSGGGSAGKAQSAASNATYYGSGGGAGGISPVNVCHSGGLGFQGIVVVRYLSSSNYSGYLYD
jgi:hypothetical protein